MWAEEKLLLLRRAFAAVMLAIIIGAVWCSVKAGAQDGNSPLERRIDRIESRQDKNFEEHTEIKQRLALVESMAERNTEQVDRMIYGMVGLTLTVTGHLILALFKLKIEQK
jgi:hypothetical protein